MEGHSAVTQRGEMAAGSTTTTLVRVGDIVKGDAIVIHGRPCEVVEVRLIWVKGARSEVRLKGCCRTGHVEDGASER